MKCFLGLFICNLFFDNGLNSLCRLSYFLVLVRMLIMFILGRFFVISVLSFCSLVNGCLFFIGLIDSLFFLIEVWRLVGNCLFICFDWFDSFCFKLVINKCVLFSGIFICLLYLFNLLFNVLLFISCLW